MVGCYSCYLNLLLKQDGGSYSIFVKPTKMFEHQSPCTCHTYIRGGGRFVKVHTILLVAKEKKLRLQATFY